MNYFTCTYRKKYLDLCQKSFMARWVFGVSFFIPPGFFYCPCPSCPFMIPSRLSIRFCKQSAQGLQRFWRLFFPLASFCVRLRFLR